MPAEPGGQAGAGADTALHCAVRELWRRRGGCAHCAAGAWRAGAWRRAEWLGCAFMLALAGGLALCDVPCVLQAATSNRVIFCQICC